MTKKPKHSDHAVSPLQERLHELDENARRASKTDRKTDLNKPKNPERAPIVLSFQVIEIVERMDHNGHARFLTKLRPYLPASEDIEVLGNRWPVGTKVSFQEMPNPVDHDF